MTTETMKGNLIEEATMKGNLIEEETISRQRRYLMLLNKIKSYKEKDEYETILRPIIEKYVKKTSSLEDMSESELFFLAYTINDIIRM